MVGDIVCGRSSVSMVLKINHAHHVERRPKFKIVKLSVAKPSSSLEHGVLEGGLGATCLSLDTDGETSNLVGIVADCHTGRRRLVAWTGAKKVV